MPIDLNQFRDLYLQESAEHIASMEANLLELRTRPGDLDLLNAIFRSAHSIKGGAGSFGLETLVRFTHALENLLDRLREGSSPATPSVVDVLLRSADCLVELLTVAENEQMPEKALAVLEALKEASAEYEATAESLPASSRAELVASAAPSVAGCTGFRVRFKPAKDILESGCDPLLLLRNLAALGTVQSCDLDAEALPTLDAMDSACFYLSWDVQLETEVPEAEVREIFEFVEDQAEIEITRKVLDAGATVEVGTAPAEIALESPAVSETAESVGPAATLQQRSGVDRRMGPTEGAVPLAIKAAAAESSIRVPIDKVDRLIDLVGELVIAQAMAEQMTRSFTPEMFPQLCEAIAGLERNTRELHERVMAIRMLPIGSLFRRYTRTVYDIGKSTGKQARVEFAGEETEIDKSMLELLADPMIHLIRNAVDHGIEQPADREAAGKPAEGVISLRASHRSGKVVLEIEDDGAGVDPAKVRSKAIERGLIQPGAEMSDAQLRMLIFEPGFSTRDQVSDLSGRGVGMDVVKRNIQQMNGTVRLESEIGKGSCITIELPLTLTIMEGLIVRVHDRKLVLPLLSVVETVSVEQSKFTRIVEGGEVFTVRGQTMPVLRMSNYLQLPSTENAPRHALLVVVEAGSRNIGLVIDELLGQQQVVLKSLERHLHRVDGLMGATILGDGRVAPILDVSMLAEMDIYRPEL